jgi:predicted nucleic acid-binding protein
MRLVVDANRVYAELHWRLRRRRNPANRSALHEAIDAGVVILFVPPYVTHEIEEHSAEIAQATSTSVSEVSEEWESFQKHLRFYIPRSRPSPTETYADIDDFPYLATWRELDAQAIYTTDRDLVQMGAPVISVLIDTQRDYARASTIVLGIGSSFSVVIGWEFLHVLYRALV